MRPLISSFALIAGMVPMALTAPAMAQPTGDPAMVASQPAPDTARETAGIPGPQAVDPAPGEPGPYVGAGRQGFYDVDARMAAMTQAAQSLRGAQKHQAMAQLHGIRSEEAIQKARHGELRDWDRESLNARLDKLAQQFPALASAGPGAPPPGQ